MSLQISISRLLILHAWKSLAGHTQNHSHSSRRQLISFPFLPFTLPLNTLHQVLHILSSPYKYRQIEVLLGKIHSNLLSLLICYKALAESLWGYTQEVPFVAPHQCFKSSGLCYCHGQQLLWFVQLCAQFLILAGFLPLLFMLNSHQLHILSVCLKKPAGLVKARQPQASQWVGWLIYISKTIRIRNWLLQWWQMIPESLCWKGWNAPGQW